MPLLTEIRWEDGDQLDWNRSSLDALMRHIVARHHLYLRQELPALERTIARMIALRDRTDANTLTSLQRVFGFFRRELELHLRKEEEVLFPLIRRMEAALREGTAPPRFAFGSIANPIGIMEQDHGAENRQIEKMLLLTGNSSAPPEAAGLYRSIFQRIAALQSDMRLHVDLEDNILFRRAGELEDAW